MWTSNPLTIYKEIYWTLPLILVACHPIFSNWTEEKWSNFFRLLTCIKPTIQVSITTNYPKTKSKTFDLLKTLALCLIHINVPSDNCFWCSFLTLLESNLLKVISSSHVASITLLQGVCDFLFFNSAKYVRLVFRGLLQTAPSLQKTEWQNDFERIL